MPFFFTRYGNGINLLENQESLIRNQEENRITVTKNRHNDEDREEVN